MVIDKTRLPRQLKYWAKHCSLNALPSFGIALVYLGLWKSPAGIVAMVLAVMCFVVGYAVATSMPALFPDEDSLTHRALAMGIKIRKWIVWVSLPCCAIPPLALLTPDLWAGMLASALLQWVHRALGSSGFDVVIEEQPSAIEAFQLTLVEGLILSFGLLMLSFFILVVFQIRERRNMVLDGR